MTAEPKKKKPVKSVPQNQGDDFSRLLKGFAESTGLGDVFKELATPENRQAALKIAASAKEHVIAAAKEIRKDAELTFLEARLAQLKKDKPGKAK